MRRERDARGDISLSDCALFSHHQFLFDHPTVRRNAAPSRRRRVEYGEDNGSALPQSFIIRFWVDEPTEETGRATWRGQITHVPSEQRRYLKDLEEVVDFIAPFLENLGVRFGVWWRIKRRLAAMFFR